MRIASSSCSSAPSTSVQAAQLMTTSSGPRSPRAPRRDRSRRAAHACSQSRQGRPHHVLAEHAAGPHDHEPHRGRGCQASFDGRAASRHPGDGAVDPLHARGRSGPAQTRSSTTRRPSGCSSGSTSPSRSASARPARASGRRCGRAPSTTRCSRFLAANPDGTVVALGEGLETGFWRVDNGSVNWLTVELPETGRAAARAAAGRPTCA